MGRLIGYARVSTLEQSLDLQLDELTTAGCKKIFSNKISGVRAVQPGLDQCLEMISAGDTLISLFKALAYGVASHDRFN